ncbi:MAG: hypothetical protein AB7P78_20650 [Candidatus Binatia bacterium]
MAQAPEIVVKFRLDEQQVESLLSTIRQIVSEGRPAYSAQQLDELMTRTSELMVTRVRELVAQGRL